MSLAEFYGCLPGVSSIFLHYSNKEKTAFIAPNGVYCYRVMPFGLKNARANYTWMISRLLRDLLGKLMAAYVDAMLVKSKEEVDHIVDLTTSF